MTNQERAEELFHSAEWAFREMERALTEGEWNIVARRAQEFVELTLKGLLILMGVEYPKTHDPGDVFAEAVRMRRLGISEEILQEIQVLSSQLARKRAPAFYYEIRVEETEARGAAEGVSKVWELSQEWKAKLKGTKSGR